MNLIQRITQLPQVLQDLIGEYNADHREQMNRVCREYFAIIYLPCKICGGPVITPDRFCSVDYFIFRVFRRGHFSGHWCSEACLEIEENELEKKNYFATIQQWISVDTLQGWEGIDE